MEVLNRDGLHLRSISPTPLQNSEVCISQYLAHSVLRFEERTRPHSKIGIEEDIDQDLERDEDRGLEIENADEVEIDVHARDPARIGEDESRTK